MIRQFVVVITCMIAGLSIPTEAVVRGGYYPSWLSASFPPTSIQFSHFTHVFYAFVQIDSSSKEIIIPLHDAPIIDALSAAAHYNNPPVKALLSIDGSSDDAVPFTSMFTSPSSRASFINSSITIARNFNLDGLDFAWRSPATTEQMYLLGELFTEWRVAVETESLVSHLPQLLITSVVNYASNGSDYDGKNTIPYPVTAMAESLDWVNVVCYDYYSPDKEPSKTGAHAALIDTKSHISTIYGLTSWVQKGMPKAKLIMGIPLYGRSWHLKDPINEHGIGAPAEGSANGDPRGAMLYADILTFNALNGTVAVYDESTVSSYAYRETTWVSYDDIQSLKYKIKFARTAEIGGYYFWALGYENKNWDLSRTACSEWQE